MKKLRYALTAALCFALILSMCSCQFIKGIFEKEEKIVVTDAKSLLQAIEKQTGKATQFRIDGKIDATITVLGQTVSITGSSKYIVIDPNSPDSYYYMENEMSSRIKGYGEETQTTVLAYYNGNAYTSNTQYDSYMYAPMTEAEFLEFSGSAASFPDILTASEQEYEQEEDGSWELELSGYSEEALEPIMKEFDPDGSFGEMVTVTDIEWTIKADSEFRVQKVKAKFILDEESAGKDDEFVFSFSGAEYEDVSPITKSLTDGTYESVADLKILRQLEDHVADLKESKDGAFTLTNKVTTISGKTEDVTEETDTVTFGEKDGKYFYTISALTDGRTIKMNYQNGKRVITGLGSPQTESFTDKESKEFIDAMIDGGLHFDVDRISTVSVNETDDGTVYTLSAVVPSATMESIFTECGESVQRIAVTIVNGKITQITNTEISNGKYGTANLYVKIENTITFP